MWWSYLIENVAWSVGGLLAGYHIGRTERAVQELNRKIDRQDDE